MAGRRDGAADGGNVARHAGGGVDLDHEDGPDLARRVRLETRLDGSRIDGVAKTERQLLHLDANEGAHLAPQRREASAAEHQHRSEEHTSELQSLMRISYAVFCLKKKKQHNQQNYKHLSTTQT